MSEKENSSFNSLEEKVNLLVKRFEEQKGIIDSYVERERDWKKNKILQNKEISQLKTKLSKEKNNERNGNTVIKNIWERSNFIMSL